MLQGEPLNAAARSFDGIRVSHIDSTVLATIINKKVESMDKIKAFNFDLKKDDSAVNKALAVSFKQALEGNHRRHFILECKKSSPSLGDFCPDFNLDKIVNCYNERADAISVLTEEYFFKGSYAYLSKVRKLSNLPILCKDFIICKEQIEIAKKIGANAVLLMLSILTHDKYLELYNYAKTLDLDVLTEVSDIDEAQFAIAHSIDIIGINNRDLKTLKIDLNNAKRLAALFTPDTIVISESGIKNHRDIVNMLPLKNFLIGSALCVEPEIEKKANELLYGFNKLCGLKNRKGVQIAIDNKFSLAGLIFVSKSPRCVNFEEAKALALDPTLSSRIDFCAVFLNEALNNVINIVLELKLKYVQLHGQENIEYIKALKKAVPGLKIIKAVSINDKLEDCDLIHIKEYYSVADLILFDSKNPGSGKEFDKDLIPQFVDKSKTLLSGGIGPDNICKNVSLNFLGVDCNSCLEKAPGDKDPILVNDLFKRINCIEE